MTDVEKILNLVAEGALTPEEADEILSALNASREPEARGIRRPPPELRPRDATRARRAICASRSPSAAGP